MSERIWIEEVDARDDRVETRAWPFAVEQRDRIDAHWEALVAEKPRLFNGRVLLQHASGLDTDNGLTTCVGRWFVTEFKAFLAWRDFGFPDRDVHNVFSMAALRSADGAFLLGEMAGHTANAGHIYFPAGTPDPSDVRGTRLDLEGSVRRELEEETGITPARMRLAPGWTLVHEGARVACMKIVDVAETADEIVARVSDHLAAEPQAELSRVHIVRALGDLDPARMPGFTIAYLRHMLA
jgi:8-oxo-dGTP pyrophosphatase MutT (NUDIX family)